MPRVSGVSSMKPGDLVRVIADNADQGIGYIVKHNRDEVYSLSVFLSRGQEICNFAEWEVHKIEEHETW